MCCVQPAEEYNGESTYINSVYMEPCLYSMTTLFFTNFTFIKY